MKRDFFLIVGQSGAGKSFFTRSVLMPRYPRVIVYDVMLEYPGLLFSDLEDLLDHCDNNPFYTVRFEDGEYFDLLCESVFALEDVLFIIEESQRAIPARASMEHYPALGDLVFRGRHKRVSLATVVQRASTLNVNFRSQYTECFAFRQVEPADLDYLYALCGDSIVYDLPTFQDGEYLHITPSGVSKHSRQ